MAKSRTFYGWEKDGKFYLSTLPMPVENRPRNEYASKVDAETEAKVRRAQIEWENG